MSEGQNVSRHMRTSPGRVACLLLLICPAMFFSGCDLKLTALILSPGHSQIEVTRGEAVSFEGAAIGGLPFTSISDSVVTTRYGYFWDTSGNPVDDGESVAEKQMVVTFDREGVFKISLTVTDRDGRRDTVSVNVIVKARVPAESLRAVILTPSPSPVRVISGETVTFKGSGMGGVPFSDDDEPYGYYWSSHSIPGAVTTTDNFKEVAIEFTTTPAGVYPLSFTVKDSRSVTATDSLQVIVLPAG